VQAVQKYEAFKFWFLSFWFLKPVAA